VSEKIIDSAMITIGLIDLLVFNANFSSISAFLIILTTSVKSSGQN
jgi:hypothetical protein